MCYCFDDVWKSCIITGLAAEISQRLSRFVRGKKIFVNVKKRLVIYGSWKGGRLEGKESEKREYNIGMF